MVGLSRPVGERLRLFVAVVPSPEVIEQLRSVPLVASSMLRPTPEEQWHVTLRFLGSCDPESVIGRLGGAQLPTAEAALGPEVTMLGERVVVAPVRGLEHLAARIGHLTSDPVTRSDPVTQEPQRSGHGGRTRHLPERPFVGHITLARLRGAVPPEQLPLGFVLAGSWTPAAIQLVSSVTHSGGAVHETVASFRLGGQPTRNA